MTPLKIIATAVGVLVLWRFLRGSTESHLETTHATEADIPALVRAGQKIDAIKVYRRLHGVDLKAAKQAIDALEAQLRANP